MLRFLGNLEHTKFCDSIYLVFLKYKDMTVGITIRKIVMHHF